MLLSSFDNLEEAENFSRYLTLKLPRFLLKQTLTSMNIAKDNFMFVPKLSWKKKWTDENLYQFFKLDNEEINYIEKIMRPMNLEQGADGD
jgi:site-specific DNA-methyltransferase (adenine-specific)